MKVRSPAVVAGIALALSITAPRLARGAPPDDPPRSALDDEFAVVNETTVTAAAKHVQLLSEAPSSVTVMTAEEIQRFGFLTLGDLLDSVRSFYVSNDRNYSYVGVRGFGRPGDYNSRVLFLLDGHPVNEHVYDSAAAIGPDAGLDLETVDRVEIVRGPGSALYGTNAFFAVINVITRRGSEIDGYRPEALGGSRGRYGSSLTIGKRAANGLDYRISGAFLDTRGQNIFFKEFDAPSTDFGWAQNLDREGTHQESLRLEYGDWSLLAYNDSRVKHVPTASFGTAFGDDAYFTRDTSSLLDVRFDHRLGRSLEITARGYYDWYATHGVYPYGGPPTVLNDDSGSAWWTGEEVNLAWQSDPSHRLTVSQSYEATFGAKMLNFDRAPYVKYVDTTTDFAQWAFFLQDEWKISRLFTLDLGARLDHHDDFGLALNPRGAAFLHFSPESTLKFLAGSAYRAPNVYERFYADGTSLEQASSLVPERVLSYEITYEHRLDIAGTLSLTAFRNDVQDLITPVLRPSGLSRYENVDSARTEGVEAEARFTLGSGLIAFGSASYTKGVDGNGSWLTNSPRQICKTGISVPVMPRSLFASTEVLYAGGRETLAGDKTPPFETVDFTLLFRLKERSASLSATVSNLFNRDNYVPGSFEHVQDQIIQPGRWLVLRFVGTF
jgi:outer membrane cobalamin receptor